MDKLSNFNELIKLNQMKLIKIKIKRENWLENNSIGLVVWCICFIMKDVRQKVKCETYILI